MADVFISYAKQDRTIAESLVATLEARGLDVWWDEALYAGDDLHDRIRAEIAKAGAVVVIWSEHAVASRWVRGEAAEAADRGTLISTHVPGFDLRRIPLDFRALHCEPVSNGRRNIEAIQRKRAGQPGMAQIPDPTAGRSDPRACGDADAQVALGYNDLQVAVRHYTAAADRGDQWGLFNLARMYAEGLGGLPKDTAMAVRLFRRAADEGNWAAPIVLMLRELA